MVFKRILEANNAVKSLVKCPWKFLELNICTKRVRNSD